MFPREATNCAQTGRIPMEFVRNNDLELRRIVAENGLRRIYRGPRRGLYSTWTLKADAQSMLLYKK